MVAMGWPTPGAAVIGCGTGMPAIPPIGGSPGIGGAIAAAASAVVLFTDVLAVVTLGTISMRKSYTSLSPTAACKSCR